MEVTGCDFSALVAQKYRRRLSAETLMVNELYVATVYRPLASMPVSWLSRLASKAQPGATALELRDALDACNKLAQTLTKGLGSGRASVRKGNV